MVLLFPSLWSLIKSFLSAPISATISSISITSWLALTMVGVAGSPSLPNPCARWVLWPSPCPGWVCSRRTCVKPASRAIPSPLPLADAALVSPSCASVSPRLHSPWEWQAQEVKESQDTGSSPASTYTEFSTQSVFLAPSKRCQDLDKPENQDSVVLDVILLGLVLCTVSLGNFSVVGSRACRLP